VQAKNTNYKEYLTMNIDNLYSNNQSAKAPNFSSITNNDIKNFKDIIENQKDNILKKLDDSGEFKFSVDDSEYTIEKQGENYIAKDSSGAIIDNRVQVNDNLSVTGFIEIGGIPGVDSSDRLYLTKTDDGKLLMIVGDAKIGDGTKEGIRELVQGGASVLSDRRNNNAVTNGPDSTGVTETVSPESPADITAVTDANANAAATMQLLNAEATRFAIEMQGLNAQKDVADDIKRF
jgi:hypothetical protein